MSSNLSSGNHYKSVDPLYNSQKMDHVENLQEELLKTKKVHAFATRECSIMRTKIKILEKELKKKDQQIDDFLREDQFVSKSEQRIEMNSLKRKVVQFERALREKTEEVAKLINDREVAKAVDTRRQIQKLEVGNPSAEEALVRKVSIPESEFFREKQQYIEVINRLTEENMEMRRIIGDFEDGQQAAAHLPLSDFDEDAFMHQLRDAALAKKQDAESYKNALNTLVNRKLKRVESRSSPWSEKAPTRTRVQRRKTSMSPAPVTQPNHSLPRRKKFPLRSQPATSKIAGLRSKSIEAPVQPPHGRLSRQFSDNHIEKTCTDCADVEDKDVGKEVMMPVYRKKRNTVMYRNALESDSSTQSAQESNHEGSPPNLSRGVSLSTPTDETAERSDGNEMPTEVFDAKGNVYLIQADEEDGPSLEEADEEANSERLASDTNEAASHSLMERAYGVPPSEVDSWPDVNSVDSEHEDNQCAQAFVRALNCHILRARMCTVRKETSEY
ncbi:IQ domain-containing protein E [Aphelenchoides fujianensis]|nr:IQ domain-containing protein E [Aphelenchoides fujianensis]